MLVVHRIFVVPGVIVTLRMHRVIGGPGIHGVGWRTLNKCSSWSNGRHAMVSLPGVYPVNIFRENVCM